MKIWKKNEKRDKSGFFTLSYENGDIFSGQPLKGLLNNFGIYQQSNYLTFKGVFIRNSNTGNNIR